MKYHGKLAGVAVLAGVFLLGSSVSARDSDTPKSADLQERVRDLERRLAKLRLARLDDNQRIDAALRDLNERLDRLEAEMARRRVIRSSSYFTPGTATGTIRLSNQLAVPATVIIDGVPYVIPAFSTRTLPSQPARMLTYEVTAVGYGMRAPVQTPLAPNETLTITVY